MPLERDKLTILPGVSNTVMLGASATLHGIFDSTGKAYHNKANPVDFKGLPIGADPCLYVRYSLRGRGAHVCVSIDLDGEDDERASFYASRGASSRVCILFSGPQAPGQYEIAWDGRDQTPDRRLLLAGAYELQIEVMSSFRPSLVRSSFTVEKPRAWGFASRRKPDTTQIVSPAKQAISKKFRTEVTTSQATAREAGMELMKSAISVWSAHSVPTFMQFDKGGKISALSVENLALDDTSADPLDSMSMTELSEGSLRDCWLLIAAGCRGANEAFAIQAELMDRQQRLDPGPSTTAMNSDLQTAVAAYQTERVLTRRDGILDTETLAALNVKPVGLGPQPSPGTILLVHTALKSWSDALSPDTVMSKKKQRLVPSGDWGPKSASAARAYCRMVGSPETSQPDDFLAMLLGISDATGVQRNLIEAAIARGANIAIGFERRLHVTAGEAWAKAFWGELESGETVASAVEVAQGAAEVALREAFSSELAKRGVRNPTLLDQMCAALKPEPTVLSREGVDVTAERLFPARYGKGAP